jgi:hypothetical protein
MGTCRLSCRLSHRVKSIKTTLLCSSTLPHRLLLEPNKTQMQLLLRQVPLRERRGQIGDDASSRPRLSPLFGRQAKRLITWNLRYNLKAVRPAVSLTENNPCFRQGVHPCIMCSSTRNVPCFGQPALVSCSTVVPHDYLVTPHRYQLLAESAPNNCPRLIVTMITA